MATKLNIPLWEYISELNCISFVFFFILIIIETKEESASFPWNGIGVKRGWETGKRVMRQSNPWVPDWGISFDGDGFACFASGGALVVPLAPPHGDEVLRLQHTGVREEACDRWVPWQPGSHRSLLHRCGFRRREVPTRGRKEAGGGVLSLRPEDKKRHGGREPVKHSVERYEIYAGCSGGMTQFSMLSWARLGIWGKDSI